MTDTPDAAKLLPFTQYRRSQIGELRPYVQGESLDGVSISQPDKDGGSPRAGDMIARNPKNHADQWLVAAKYFADNFEPENTRPQPAPPEGEPDFVNLGNYLIELVKGGISATWVHIELERMYRLGLAARPKVEDAALVLWKKQYGAVASDPTLSEDEARTLLTKAYDLLERVAGERDQAIATMQWIDGENSIAMKRANAADSKLAEREAELAKADAEVYRAHAAEYESGGTLRKEISDACERHAERQQQND